MDTPIKFENGKIQLLREITRDDFNVVREKPNSVCFILMLAEEFWDYIDYHNEVKAEITIKLKDAALLAKEFKLEDNNALALCYKTQIVKAYRYGISRMCTNNKNRDKVKENIEKTILEEDLENKFYSETIKKITEAITRYNALIK